MNISPATANRIIVGINFFNISNSTLSPLSIHLLNFTLNSFLIELIFNSLPGGKYAALIFVLVFIFLLGFILDFLEICYVIVPLVAPPLLMMGFDPVWLAILLAINLQTSFLTPPFGFSLFYLRGVADEAIETYEIYMGVIPFIIIQLLVMIVVLLIPGILLTN